MLGGANNFHQIEKHEITLHCPQGCVRGPRDRVLLARRVGLQPWAQPIFQQDVGATAALRLATDDYDLFDTSTVQFRHRLEDVRQAMFVPLESKNCHSHALEGASVAEFIECWSALPFVGGTHLLKLA